MKANTSVEKRVKQQANNILSRLIKDIIKSMKRLILKANRRLRRKHHVRKRVFGSPERLRLTVFRSLNHIYAQIVDDTVGKTLVAASTVDNELRERIEKTPICKVEQSKLVGSLIAKKAIEKNIKIVSFDRNGFLYHGRIKALAEAAREAGLEF
jgi:large subunit ribosomal protein L18